MRASSVAERPIDTRYPIRKAFQQSYKNGVFIPGGTDKLTDESEYHTQIELLVSETVSNENTDKLEDSLVSATRNANIFHMGA